MKSTGIFTRVERNKKLYGLMVVVQDSETGMRVEFPLPTESLWHMLVDCQKLEDEGYTEYLDEVRAQKRYSLGDELKDINERNL